MDATAVDDALSLLKWGHILDACHDGPASRSEIADRADCSRSTAYRSTSELGEQGLLERTDRGYRLTGLGVATLEHVRQFATNVAGTSRIRPLFEYADHPELIRLAARFEDAELVTPKESVPYHIENRMKAVIEDTSERMFGMTGGLGSPALAEAMFERLQDGVDVDWILEPGMYDQFNGAYGDLSSYASDDGETTVFVHDEIPVDLVVYDETVTVLGFDYDRGVLGLVAITDDPVAVQWACDAFDDCRRAAEQVE